MPDNYNLKRFYDEAWDLLVRYDFLNEHCRLRVSFDYNDNVLHTPEVDCSITYSSSIKEDKQILIMGYGPSPFCAFRKFELDLMQTKEGYPPDFLSF